MFDQQHERRMLDDIAYVSGVIDMAVVHSPPGTEALRLVLFAFLNLAFLEQNMLAHDGVVFAKFKLLGIVFRVLFGHVKKAGVGRADHFDIVFCFSHDVNLIFSLCAGFVCCSEAAMSGNTGLLSSFIALFKED